MPQATLKMPQLQILLPPLNECENSKSIKFRFPKLQLELKNTITSMYEVLHHYLPKIQKSTVVERLSLEKHKFFVVSSHREENVNNEDNFKSLIDSLNLVADRFRYPVIVSTHPRTRKVIESGKIDINRKIQFLKPLGFTDYNSLQINAFATLSDSGTISEESSILNFPALNIREAHERPEAMEEASVTLTGLNPDRILQGLVQLKALSGGSTPNFREVYDYSMPNVADKVVRIIISYVDYVKRVVWQE